MRKVPIYVMKGCGFNTRTTCICFNHKHSSSRLDNLNTETV